MADITIVNGDYKPKNGKLENENQRKLGKRLEKMENDVNGVCGNPGERLSMVL